MFVYFLRLLKENAAFNRNGHDVAKVEPERVRLSFTIYFRVQIIKL